jgi:hypothetical protein
MMFQNTVFTPTRQAMMAALIVAIYPVAGYTAVAGRVEFATAGVTATGTDGKPRALNKGVAIEAGDLIQTMDGRAQLRFSDGGLVSLQPNTEFRIDEYSFDGKTDGSEKGFFSLVKGGLRAITGAIGHVNKKNYQVNTAVATIGIRGTEFLALLNDTLQMTCGEGICVLFNEGGELVLNAGESGKARNRKESPEGTPEKANLPPEQNPPDPRFEFYSSSEDRDVNGNPCSITGCATGVMPSGVSGFAAAYTSGYNLDGGEGFTATFNGSGQLTMLDAYGHYELGNKAVVISSGNDGIIAWGRWLGDVADGGEGATTFGANDGWHYVVGIPTSYSDMSALYGSTATYRMIGATIPSSSTLGNGVFNGSLNVDFSNYQLQTQFDLKFASGTASFAYSDTYSSYIYGPQFSGSASSSSGSLCSSGCSASFTGFFAGPEASRAGMAYKVETSNYDIINGAAAFTKSGPGVPVSMPIN